MTKLNLFERLSGILCGGKVKLLITPCTLQVLKALGDEYFGAFIQAKRFEMVRTHCPHAHLTVDDLLKETAVTAVKIPANEGTAQKQKLLNFSADCLLTMCKSQNNKYHYMVASQNERLLRKCRKLTGIPTIHIYRNVVILDPLPEAAKENLKAVEMKKLTTTEQEKAIIKSVAPLEKKKKKHVIAPKKRKIKGPNPLSMKKKKVAVAKKPSPSAKIASS